MQVSRPVHITDGKQDSCPYLVASLSVQCIWRFCYRRTFTSRIVDLADFISLRFAIRKVKDFLSTGKFSGFFSSFGFVSRLIGIYLFSQAHCKPFFWILYLSENRTNKPRKLQVSFSRYLSNFLTYEPP